MAQAVANPMTIPQQQEDQSDPADSVTQPTLEEYAAGIENVNFELQRQSQAYGHFRSVLQQLDKLDADPSAKLEQQLPFVLVKFPQKGDTPGEMKIDLNSLPTATLLLFRPVFELLSQGAGEGLLTAWESIHNVTEATKPIVTAARKAQGVI